MENKYGEAVALLDLVAMYSGYMAKSHNADEFQRNFVKYDDARQQLLVIIKEALSESK